eukprot:gnl/TRDRNA2_/TRDRNA2_40024_c0_seq2.p1 gnl/TRDRNA2_/TRDRNA2_40024_c0~~gnl/TRDRNA2_/TRDRNA2_40024_c0_seq2.p1  ORF type:complete len:275 (+),score=54.04 gnl/TRDRNA2_/TRDRNA2_40024_c0_seq2:40-864(+)
MADSGTSGDAAVNERPDDSEILAQERGLRAEAEAAPVVGSLVSLEPLKEQYAQSPGFLPKIQSLDRRFGSLRRTRPDGNCFYRAYLFGFLELLVGSKERQELLLPRAKRSLEYCSGFYERVAIEDFYDEFLACCTRASAEGATVTDVEAAFAECDGYLVCWARCLCSAYLKRHEEEYAAFLVNHSSMKEFCAHEVDPMSCEADHLQIIGLSSYFGVPACVVYLDQSAGDEPVEHRFQGEEPAVVTPPADGSAMPNLPPVYLLYRPGHYDIIYPR